MQDSKNEGKGSCRSQMLKIYSGVLSILLLNAIVLSGCSKQGNITQSDITDNTTAVSQDYSDDYNEMDDILFQDVLDDISAVSFVDEYLKDNDYENLVSDYMRFKDSGDLESAQRTLFQLGEHIFKGSVIEMLCRSDEKFMVGLDKDYTMDDVTVSYDDDKIYVFLNRGERDDASVGNERLCAVYDNNVRQCIYTLYSLQSGETYSAEGLDIIFDQLKEGLLFTAYNVGDTSIIDAANSTDGIIHGTIAFDGDPEKNMAFRK